MQQELGPLRGVRSSLLTWGLPRRGGEDGEKAGPSRYLTPFRDPEFPPSRLLHLWSPEWLAEDPPPASAGRAWRGAERSGRCPGRLPRRLCSAPSGADSGRPPRCVLPGVCAPSSLRTSWHGQEHWQCARWLRPWALETDWPASESQFFHLTGWCGPEIWLF